MMQVLMMFAVPACATPSLSLHQNHFFDQLFNRLSDFSRIFPDIRSRADIFSKVMGFCISIRIEEMELVKLKLKHLGQIKNETHARELLEIELNCFFGWG